MKAKLLAAQPLGRSYAVAFDSDDDLLTKLEQFLGSEGLAAGRFSGIGGFRRATLSYYDVTEKRYLPIEVEEQVEVLSIVGNVATYDDKPRIHSHCVVGHRDGRTTGGHLLSGIVRPTLELMFDEIAVGLQRRDRPDVGIPLFDF